MAPENSQINTLEKEDIQLKIDHPNIKGDHPKSNEDSWLSHIVQLLGEISLASHI